MLFSGAKVCQGVCYDSTKVNINMAPSCVLHQALMFFLTSVHRQALGQLQVPVQQGAG